MTQELPADIAEAIDGLQFAYEAVEQDAVLHEARKALDAAILKHMGGWRPIESIPKDGRKVMLYRPLAGESNDPVISIRRTTSTSQHCWPDTIPPGCDAQNFTEGCCYATHWQPLPEPPATDLGRAALAEEGRGTDA